MSLSTPLHPTSATNPPASRGPRRPLTILLGSALLASLLSAGGCAQPGRLDANSAPDDFMLGLTVFEPPTPIPGQRTRTDLPRALMPSRYVIESDGILRAAFGNAASPSRFPAQTRRLHPQQVDAIWLLTRETGVFDGAGETVGAVVAYQPPRDRITGLVEAFAAGQRGYAAFGLEEDQPGSAATRALSDALADLAWAPQQPVDVGAELRAREALSDPLATPSPAQNSPTQKPLDQATSTQSLPAAIPTPTRPGPQPETTGTGTTGTGIMTPVPNR